MTPEELKEIESLTPEERAARGKEILESPEMQHAISEMAKELRTTVEHIENSPETTQNHYGAYLSLLSEFQGNTLSLFMVSNALKAAGGNREGIASALRILVQ